MPACDCGDDHLIRDCPDAGIRVRYMVTEEGPDDVSPTSESRVTREVSVPVSATPLTSLAQLDSVIHFSTLEQLGSILMLGGSSDIHLTSLNVQIDDVSYWHSHPKITDLVDPRPCNAHVSLRDGTVVHVAAIGELFLLTLDGAGKFDTLLVSNVRCVPTERVTTISPRQLELGGRVSSTPPSPPSSPPQQALSPPQQPSTGRRSHRETPTPRDNSGRQEERPPPSATASAIEPPPRWNGNPVKHVS